jgi:hypothetical protein
MSFLFVEDEEARDKISIDELYDREQKRDLKQVEIFNKILNRVHKRINVTSRNKRGDKHIWFAIPEYIIGQPIYSAADCIAFVIAKLTKNGFFVKYMHPNTIFVSWENWIPAYVRNEFKKRTGNIIDENGKIIQKKGETDETMDPNHPDALNQSLFNDRSGGGGDTANSVGSTATGTNQKQYTPIAQYKPTGNLVYNQEFFEKLEKKMY